MKKKTRTAKKSVKKTAKKSTTTSASRSDRMITITLPEGYKADLEKLADESGTNRSKYCQEILKDAIQSGTIVDLNPRLIRSREK